MILVLDNRDSFTFNLVQALLALGVRVEAVRAADTTATELLERTPDGIVVGPGPGRPEEAHVSQELFRKRHTVPILGVCLGHQALALAFGGRIGSAPELVHGRAVPVEHTGVGVFRGLPSPLSFTRYNSLSVTGEIPPALERTAWSADGDTLGLRHRERPLEGVQFHPESILSERGCELLANFVSATAGR